jgi:hypothetical protein
MPPRFAYWTIILDGAPTSFRTRERDEILPLFNQFKAKNPAALLKWFSGGTLWDSPEQAKETRALEKVKRFRQERTEAKAQTQTPGSSDPGSPDPLAEFRRQHGRPADGSDDPSILRQAQDRPEQGRGATRGREERSLGAGPSSRPERRGRDWRPGGEHRDPRDKYKLPPGEARKRWKDRNLGPRGPKPFGSKPGGDRPYGDRPRGPKPFGAKPRSDRPYGGKPSGDRGWSPGSSDPGAPRGPKPFGSKPGGDRPYGDRPRGPKPFGAKPRSDRPYGGKPSGDRGWSPGSSDPGAPRGPKPFGSKPGGDRPYGDRPRGPKPFGAKPGGDRPYGDRPRGRKPFGSKPGGDRPYGDRPRGPKPFGSKPGGDRPYGDRPRGPKPFGSKPGGPRGKK